MIQTIDLNGWGFLVGAMQSPPKKQHGIGKNKSLKHDFPQATDFRVATQFPGETTIVGQCPEKSPASTQVVTAEVSHDMSAIA